jgi:hypothetical protein
LDDGQGPFAFSKGRETVTPENLRKRITDLEEERSTRSKNLEWMRLNGVHNRLADSYTREIEMIDKKLPILRAQLERLVEAEQ